MLQGCGRAPGCLLEDDGLLRAKVLEPSQKECSPKAAKHRLAKQLRYPNWVKEDFVINGYISGMFTVSIMFSGVRPRKNFKLLSMLGARVVCVAL